MIDESKLQKYYGLLEMRKFLERQIGDLNDEIKGDIEPGTTQIGRFRVDLQLKKKYQFDWSSLDPEVLSECTVSFVDPDLIESAYLRGDISDDDMRTIRGEPRIIQALSVQRVDDV